MAKGQWRTLLGGMAFGIAWMSCQAVMPAVIGLAIDRGVAAKDAQQLVFWSGVCVVAALLWLTVDVPATP